MPQGSPLATKTKKAEQAEATRGALLRAARELFAAKGFADTSTEEIVVASGITRGALYYHYRDKEALFAAVFEELEQELVDRVFKAAVRSKDPVERLQLGFAEFFDACLDPAVQRIVLVEGPSVLGWDLWHEIDCRYMFGLVEAGVRESIEAGLLREQSTEQLAHLLMGGACQAALVVARSSTPRKARAAAGEALHGLIEGLRTKRKR